MRLVRDTNQNVIEKLPQNPHVIWYNLAIGAKKFGYRSKFASKIQLEHILLPVPALEYTRFSFNVGK